VGLRGIRDPPNGCSTGNGNNPFFMQGIPKVY
jgi:hypothetical protein